jgi:hypothetical protein
LGIHAGALYDHRQQKVQPMLGLSLEGYGPIEGNKPSAGARTGFLYPFNGTTRVSLQPEGSLPIVPRTGNVTLAAGIASGPLAFHSTLCYRHFDIGNYGACAHWFSDGSYGGDLNLNFFFPILFASIGNIR